MPRNMFGWARTIRPVEEIVHDFDGLGIEMVHDYPAYDNGKYIVIDVVKDLDWAVMDYNGVVMCRVPLDKYEAIKRADEYLEADRGEE